MSNESSFHRRVRELVQRREARCRSAEPLATIPGECQEFLLDGANLVDVPAFYLELGQQLEPTFGYYGACLDSLADCLSPGIGGVRAPFKLLISNGRNLTETLDWRAWFRYRAAMDFFRGTPDVSDMIEWGRLPEKNPEEALEVLHQVDSGAPIVEEWAELFDIRRVSFWECFVELLQEHDVEVVYV